MAQPGDLGGDLEAGQLAALAGLGALRDLDFDLAAMSEVVGGDPEARRGDLFDRRVCAVAVRAWGVTLGPLAAFARTGRRAHAVHGDGKGLVGFGRERAQRHGAALEALADPGHGLHLVEGHGRTQRLELQQIA